jgi:hypothetical protein
MMTSKELFANLKKHGVELSLDGENLRYRAPKGVLTSELRQALVEQKQAILTLLQTKMKQAPIVAAPTVPEPDSSEKELDEDIDEPSERKKIAVAPAIPTCRQAGEDHQCAWTLAGCYLWLTSKNMSERKGVMFTTPRPFQELANKNLLLSVPKEASWTTWNRIHGCALENFLYSKENIKEYKQALKEVMCSTPPWWREKYLANSEISTMTEE